MRKAFPSLATVFLFLNAACVSASYLYNGNGQPVAAPDSYRVAAVWRFDADKTLLMPEDLTVGRDGHVFIADTGNNRILTFRLDTETVSVLERFDWNGSNRTFSGPEGVCLTKDGLIAVADTRNGRIVLLDATGERAVQVITRPDSDILRPEYQFRPSKLAVDDAGRIYTVGPGMYEGIMDFDQDGRFSGFLGTNRVRFRLGDWVWKKLSTREQREGMTLFIPEEFSNIDVDPQGFLYSTTRMEDSENPIKRHNAEGRDILNRSWEYPPAGDIETSMQGSVKGNSTFLDIAVEGGGIYHALDGKRNRIFSYNPEGRLISVIGGIGDTRGTFLNPVALALDGDRLLVLDKAAGSVTVLEPTAYGNTVREAMESHDAGDYETAERLWNTVLEMNANMELAYSGLGKIHYRRGAYAEAARLFRLGNDRTLYSKAYAQVRKASLRRLFGPVMTALVVLVIVNNFLKSRSKKKENVPVRLRYQGNIPLYRRVWLAARITVSPFDSYSDMKTERIATGRSTAIVLLLYALVSLSRAYFTGFLFDDSDSDTVNLLRELVMILLPLGLFCLGNWSLTSLMDGEGSFTDILKSTAYALGPMILIFSLTTVLSNILILEEESVIRVLDSVAVIWSLWLIFIANKSIHGYEVGKTVGMLLLTLVAIAIILFLSLLFITFVEQVWAFLESLYKEVVFRI